MTRVVISQPMYFPWVGFMAQMALADVMIWLDDVTFSKGSFTNRVQVKLPDNLTWMSVPLVGKGQGTLIRDLVTTDPTIKNRHRDLLCNAYIKAPNQPEMLKIFDAAWDTERPLNGTLINSAEQMAVAIGLPPRQTLRSSQMDVDGSGSDRVLALVKAVHGSNYITGHGARNYLDHTAFDTAGVSVEYMNYAPVPWPQGQGAFTPYVTALDLIAHTSPPERTDHLAPQTIEWQKFLAKY